MKITIEIQEFSHFAAVGVLVCFFHLLKFWILIDSFSVCYMYVMYVCMLVAKIEICAYIHLCVFVRADR